MRAMPLSYFHPKAESSPIAVFSVESGCVILTVFDFDREKKEEFVHIARASLDSDDKLSPADLLKKTCQKIDEMFKQLFDEKHTYAIAKANVLVLLGSPWHISWSDKILVKKEHNFRVTKNLINDSIRDSFYGTHKDMSILGKHIESVKMNGYQMKTSVGKSTQSLELDVYIESAPNEALSSISQIIKKYLPHARINWSTYTYTAASAIQESLGVKDFLLVMPEHEVTEIALIKDGIIQAEASMPLGTATLARELFGKSSSGIKEAISKTKRFLAGTLSESGLKTASLSMDVIKKNFFEDFRNILWQMNTSVLFPDTVFVTGKNVASYFFSLWIKSENYSNETFTIGGFKTIMLGGKDIMARDSSLDKIKHKVHFISAASSLAAKSFEMSIK